MRPVRRNSSPITGDFNDYSDAKKYLVSRFGSYCSYCERKIATNLAVEHIEPKNGNFGKPLLEKKWSNFLLACVNCNSSKGSKQIIFNDIFLPDRDNTFYAFQYYSDGKIKVNSSLNSRNSTIAKNTLKLLGLDKDIRKTLDEYDKQISLDKASQRMEVWGIAEEALKDYESNLTNQAVKRLIIENMKANGFFSIWMTVFDSYSDMKNLFIDGMDGTRESGCFDSNTATTISPHPNLDALNGGGKI